MSIQERLYDDGVAELILTHPPVNAFTIGDLQDLASRLDAIAHRPEVRVVVFRSEGPGFCGGGDLGEVQGPGFEGILGQARGSYHASLAVAECVVPVIIAVHRYCIGVGVLLAGASDMLVADADARFVMAEIDNGATGGAIQASGLMPDKRLRVAMFTCEPVLASELAGYGTVQTVPAGASATQRALAIAATVAAKSPEIVRLAKRSINGSIGRDIRNAYRLELSYTYELNLIGEASRARQTFLDGERVSYVP